MAIAGKVAITPKGNWSASAAYQKLDLVYYNNGSYVAIQPSTGITPTNTAYWMLVLQSENNADIQNIINGETKVGDADKLDGHNSSYFAKDSDLAIERERITNLATLTEGSTTGDAELIDIRVGEDGVTYDSAGEAVRTQFANVKSDLSKVKEDFNDIFVTGKNIIDKDASDVIYGGFTKDGVTITKNENFTQSGLCKVKPSTSYVTNYPDGFIVWYGINKEFLSQKDSTNYVGNCMTSPVDAYYARFVTTTDKFNTFIFCEGTEIPEYEPYYCYIPRSLLDMKGEFVKPEDTTFFTTSKNLVNINDEDVILGGYYDSYNVFTENENFNQTGFIEVEPNTDYVSNVKNLFVVLYDKNKKYIGYVSSFDNTSYFTTTLNTGYIRMPCTVGDWETFQIEKGTESTNYEPYYLVVKSENIPKERLLKGLRFTSLGDSITAQEKWQGYVVDELGLVHTNCGIGSTALSGNDENAFWQNARLDAVKASNPDIVTILGGANDLVLNPIIGTEAELTKALSEKDKNTFIGAYSYIIENLLTWRPTLEIMILGTTWAHNDGADLSSQVTYSDFSEACRLVANHYGLPFVDLHGNCGFNDFTMGNAPYNVYSSDHIHPNKEGGKKIASLVIAKMKECYSK